MFQFETRLDKLKHEFLNNQEKCSIYYVITFE